MLLWVADFRLWISPAVPWSTSRQVFLRWSARSFWDAVLAIRSNRCHRTASSLALSGHACCGWGGSASTQEAPSRLGVWPPARSSPRISPQLPQLLDGVAPSGCVMENRVPWAQFRVPSLAWLRSLLPQVLSGQCPLLRSVLSQELSAI